jgi:rRNA maturation endonuclease Nob1
VTDHSAPWPTIAAALDLKTGAAEDTGGDPACWLDRVCDACGRLADGPDEVCPRCGGPMPTTRS